MVYMLTLGLYGWSMLPYIAFMDPMGMEVSMVPQNGWFKTWKIPI